jgi:hypothetical protein
LGVIYGDFPGRFSRTAGANFHFVFARVRIGYQVADIRDVHHMPHLVSVEFQRAAQDIFKKISPQIADMGIVVDSRTTGIHADLRRVERFKFTQIAGMRVK